MRLYCVAYFRYTLDKADGFPRLELRTHHQTQKLSTHSLNLLYCLKENSVYKNFNSNKYKNGAAYNFSLIGKPVSHCPT